MRALLTNNKDRRHRELRRPSSPTTITTAGKENERELLARVREVYSCDGFDEWHRHFVTMAALLDEAMQQTTQLADQRSKTMGFLRRAAVGLPAEAERWAAVRVAVVTDDRIGLCVARGGASDADHVRVSGVIEVTRTTGVSVHWTAAGHYGEIERPRKTADGVAAVYPPIFVDLPSLQAAGATARELVERVVAILDRHDAFGRCYTSKLLDEHVNWKLQAARARSNTKRR